MSALTKAFDRKLCAILGLLLLCSQCGVTSSTSCNLENNFCSCDSRTATVGAGTCTDFVGGQSSTKEENCLEDEGDYSSTELCPTENRVGTCKVSILGLDSHIRYYSTYTNALAAEAACNINGISFSWISILGGDPGFEWVGD